MQNPMLNRSTQNSNSLMLTLKRKKLAFTLFCVLAGLGYFTAMSSVEINFFLKGYVAIVPLQVAALVYVAYLRWIAR